MLSLSSVCGYHKRFPHISLLTTLRQIIPLVLAIFVYLQCVAATSIPPNMVFMVVDDLGWDDVGFHGSEIKTPNIDKLAFEGIILNNYYVQPICTPTRGAIMTGKYPIHTGLQHHVIVGADAFGLPLSEKTLPQYLKEFGYNTHIVGKWHLGFMSKDYLPENRGFDSHTGYFTGHGDYFDHHTNATGFFGLDLHHNGSPIWNESEVYSTELFTTYGVNILRGHDKSKPLFLYVAYQGVHAGNGYDPIQAPQSYVDRFPYINDTKRRTFAGAMSAVDDSVGQLVNTLQDLGLAENTIIVITTDNGGPTNGTDNNSACNWPLRGNKNTLWQGGVRGVGLVHSPLFQRSGYVSEGMMHVVDWLPTLLDAATNGTRFRDSPDTPGLNSTRYFNTATNPPVHTTEHAHSQGFTPADVYMQYLTADIDGVSVWKELSSGKIDKDWPRQQVLLNIDPILERGALIVGDLKLIYGPQHSDGWYPPPGGKVNTLRRNWDVLHTPDGGVEDLFYVRNKNHASQDNKSRERSDSTHDHPRSTLFYDSDHKPIILDCGAVPFLNASYDCDPVSHPCVFNLTSDPCEYYNLAIASPDLVTQLMSWLEVYNNTAIPPANQPADPRADPQLHGGVWEPWL